MRKLIKWTFLSAAVLGIGGFFFLGTNAFSYAETAFEDMKKSVRENVPIDFELRRARTLIEKIDPEILEARREVARAEVDLEGLQADIRRLEGAIAKNESKVKRLRGIVAVAQSDVVPASASYAELPPIGIVRSELARSFDLYKNQLELRESKKRLSERQARVLEAARSKLHAVRSERQQVAELVAKLETRKRQLDAMAATARRFDIDSSALGEARELLDSIKKRLDVTQKMIAENVYYGEEEGSDEPGRDVIGEVDKFFGAPSKEAQAQGKLGNDR
ncbi:MAG: hypothetical protein CSA62_06260 [Planctomycetota bacterium]|nr:MAG: hypothetical protein CSA62_06260 [Planctomycetota bacterium]